MTRASEIASRRWGESLGEPFNRLNKAQRRVWDEIKQACPIPLRRWDCIWLSTSAMMVADWRSGNRDGDVAFLRECYRWLAKGRVPLRQRRALLFPDRSPRA